MLDGFLRSKNTVIPAKTMFATNKSITIICIISDIDKITPPYLSIILAILLELYYTILLYSLQKISKKFVPTFKFTISLFLDK